MARRSLSPIMTWVFWSALVLGAFLTVTWEYFVAGLTADTSKITWLILGFFIYGFIASLLVAFHLEAEFKSLKAMEEDHRVTDPNSSGAAAMFQAALEQIRQGDRVNVRNLVTAYGAKLKGRVDNIGVVSGMLITIGLLGTVVGLIITVTGLGQVLQSSSADFASMKEGLNQAFAGMGSAFYTTFFGALLGGVVLKVLAAEMRKSAQVLVADALEFGELFVSPKIHSTAVKSLAEMEDRVSALNDQLGSLSNSFGNAVEMIDSRQATLSEGLSNLVASVSQASMQAAEQSEQLVQGISASLDESSRQADERMQVMARSIEAATQHTNTKADEKLAVLIGNVEKSMEVTRKDAEDRLAAKAVDVAGKLNEAASILSELAGADDSIKNNAHSEEG